MSASASTAGAKKRAFIRTESSVLGPQEKKVRSGPEPEVESMEVDLTEDVGEWQDLDREDRMKGHAVYNWGIRQTF